MLPAVNHSLRSGSSSGAGVLRHHPFGAASLPSTACPSAATRCPFQASDTASPMPSRKHRTVRNGHCSRQAQSVRRSARRTAPPPLPSLPCPHRWELVAVRAALHRQDETAAATVPDTLPKTTPASSANDRRELQARPSTALHSRSRCITTTGLASVDTRQVVESEARRDEATGSSSSPPPARYMLQKHVL